MHYANENQLSALKQLGFTPTEDKTTLTEVAQWLWSDKKIETLMSCQKGGNIEATVYYLESEYWELYSEDDTFYTIPEALSWAIDQAIKYLQELK